MNGFIGISKLHATNLAMVAPGIAEPLLAVACGLIAAIGAVVIYDHIAPQIASYKELVATAASAVMALASGDLSHGNHVITDAVGIDAQRSSAERPKSETRLRMRPILSSAPPTLAPKAEVPSPPNPKPKPPERHRRIVTHEPLKPNPHNGPCRPATAAPLRWQRCLPPSRRWESMAFSSIAAA
jgi:hypothetical protein